MFRSLLSACSIAVLVLPTLFFPTIARSCPVKAPETLLSLYRNSDAIYVARYDKAEDLDIIEVSGEETVLNIRKHFDVSSALKGEPRKLFTLEEREYRYRIDQSQPPSDEPAEEDREEVDALYSRPSLESGDTVLLFLKNYPQPNGDLTLGLTDYRDAIKKLSGDRLDAYQARIRELNSIFGGKKTADNAELVDWLVRTTQDPLTRWEGAYELQSSYETMQWQERRKAEEEAAHEKEDSSETAEATASADEREAGEAVEAETETEVELTEEESFDNSVYARLLTDAQKQALMSVLVDSATEQASSSKKNKSLSEADKVLIELVSNWGDSRLAKFLLDRMQREAESPYVVFRLMATTVTILDDEHLEKIAQKYQGLYYEDRDSFVDADDDEEEAAGEEEAAADGSDTSAVEESSGEGDKIVSADDNAEARSDDAAEQPRRVTYGELRADLLSRFVARTAIAIVNAEAKEVAKAER